MAGICKNRLSCSPGRVYLRGLLASDEFLCNISVGRKRTLAILKSLIITKHFLDFKIICGIILTALTKEQTFGPKEPQGIGIKGVKMGSRRSTTRKQLSAPNPLYFPHCFRLFPSTSSPLPPHGPFQLAQKCAPTTQQVQNPALKCARPFLNGFKMRAARAPRCANFPKNPIPSPKTKKTAIFDNTPCQIPLEKSAPHDAPAPNPPKPAKKHLPSSSYAISIKHLKTRRNFTFPSLRIKWTRV